jgi:DNA-binding IclR family transcriptional regulator
MSPRVATRTMTDCGWTFLTNHAHVLLCIAQRPEARLRDVADQVGITERAVQRIVAELDAGGYLYKTRDGRRNRYVVRGNMPLRHPMENHCTVSALIEVAAGILAKTRKRTTVKASKRSRSLMASGRAKDRSSSTSA